MADKRNSTWTDSSGFEFNLSPVDYTSTTFDQSKGGEDQRGLRREAFYNASYPENDGEDGWQKWGNWLDKFETDARFLAVSDSNAFLYGFPEVDAPWKFTEYTFKGVRDGVSSTIEPELFSPSTLNKINDTLQGKLEGDELVAYETLYKYQGESGAIKTHEQWDELNWTDEEAEQNKNTFTRLEEYTKKAVYKYPSSEDGVRLYKRSLEVEAMKIGEHGNVPPNTVNMSAPAEYFDPSNIYSTVVVPKYTATAGNAVLNETSGIIDYTSGPTWRGLRKILIDPVTGYNSVSPSGQVGTRHERFAPVLSGSPVQQPGPKMSKDNVLTIKYVKGGFNDGELVHNGCSFWQGNDSEVGCSLAGELSDSDIQSVPSASHCQLYPTGDEITPKEYYEEQGGTCPYYAGTGPNNIALYEASAKTTAEWASMYAGKDDYDWAGGANNYVDGGAVFSSTSTPMGGGALMWGGFAMGAAAALNTPTTQPRDLLDTGLKWHVEYEFQKIPAEGRQINSTGRSTLEGKLDYYERATGKFAIDKRENNYGGIDYNHFGDRNMMSIWRWNNKIMPCYNAEKCNLAYGHQMHGGTPSSGPAGIDGADHCKYYNQMCPYLNVPRRALEYDYNYTVLLSSILVGFRASGIDGFGLSEYQIEGGNLTEITEAPANPSGVFVAVGDAGVIGDVTTIEDVPATDKHVYFYYTVSKYDENHKYSDVFAHLLQYNHDNKKVFNNLPSTESNPTGYPVDVPWLVKLIDDYKSPKELLTFITNENKFFGGRAPEYRDLTEMKDEILCIQGAGGGMDDTTNGNKGGNPLNSSQDKGFYRGYYPDIDGESIVDGRALGDPAPSGYSIDSEWNSSTPGATNPPSTGYDFTIPGTGSRISGKYTIRDGATPINGAISNSVITPEKTLSPVVRKVFIFSSDTREIIDCTKIHELSNDEGDDITPNGVPVGQLPTERKYFRCPTCSEPYLEQPMNVDDVAPSGVTASGVYVENIYINQEITDLEAEILQNTCPSCGETLQEEGTWTHFPRLRSRGVVSVFGLPGQTVREDGYYWKSPTVVNSGHVREILGKLGEMKENKTGYKLNESSSSGTSESNVVKLPPASGNYLKPGLPEPSGKWAGESWDGYPNTASDQSDLDLIIEGTYSEFSNDATRVKDALEDAGMVLPKERLAGGEYRDDIVSPYDTEVDGLDIVSVNHLKKLRNMICPLYAYPVGRTVVADYHDKKQVSNRHRYDKYEYRTIANRHGTIEPQIIAATESGRDQWVQYWDGKFPPTYIHEYFPTGTCWWRINQAIGGITRQGGISGAHFDAAGAENTYPYGNYTGDKIASKCYMFLHGYVPLDKEVVKAYAIIRPAGEPAHGGVGTVWTGARLWKHYHPFRTKHEGKGIHNNFYFNGEEEEKKIKEEWLDSQPYSAGEDRYSSYKWDNKATFDNKMIAITTNWDEHYGFSGALSDWGHVLSWDGFNSPIIQNYTEEQMWKTYTFDEFRKEVGDGLVKCRFVAGDPEMGGSSYHFYQYSERVLEKFLINETQPIPNYFDYSGLNSKRMYPKSGPIYDTKTSNTSWASGGQLITQADEANFGVDNGGWASGGEGNASAGQIPRILDITRLVKKKYNARLDRYYKATTGNSYESLHDLTKNDRIRPGFADGYDDPDKGINYRYWKQNSGQWLNDPWHYPELINDELQTVLPGDPHSVDPSGRITEISDWYKEVGVESDADDGWYTYHPSQLIKADNDEYNSGAPSPSGYWYVLSSTNKSQQFSMDLRNFPIENTRKNWRYEAGHWDVSNVICPNKTCTVNVRQMSVSQFTLFAQNGGRTNVIPSSTAKNCAVCGTDLTKEPATGAQYTGGDGILTVYYDEEQNKDSFINGIVAHSVDGVPGLSLVKQGFDIEVKSSTNIKWHSILSVDYNSSTGKWEYPQYDENKNLVTIEADTLPTIFKGTWVNGEDLSSVADNYLDGYHFISPYARHVRYKSKPNELNIKHPSNTGVDFTGTSISGQKFVMPSGHAVKDSDWQGGVLEFLDSEGEVVNSNSIISNSPTEIFCSSNVDTPTEKWRLAKDYFVSSCSKFEVYGYENKPSQIRITEDASTYEELFTVGVDTIVMNEFPTKILSVKAGYQDSASIQMTEVYEIKKDTWVWDTITKSDGSTDKNYQSIQSGVYFFDPESASIRVPTTYKNTSNADINGLIWSMNEDVPELEFITVPNFIQIRYFSGIGKPLTVPITAIDQGPSYQVEKEAICNIVGFEPDGERPAEAPEPSLNALPSIGKSVKLGSDIESKSTIHWQVYNHKPIAGEFSMSYIVGNEMPAKGWTDSDIANLFGGDTQEEPPESTKLRGTATGEVTLYGSPNTIVSGDLYVYAKALTQREYEANGEKVVTYERTGGLKYTGFSVGVELEDVIDNRQGLCYGIPEILVYMRERDNTEIPEME